MAPTLALQVVELHKNYFPPNSKAVQAVRGISLQVRAGECVGLLGPNGAGKSTSMKCITGFFAPTKGQVRILGVDVHVDPRTARRELGVCAQDDTLDTDFDVLDQMVQFAAFFDLPRSVGEQRAKKLLEQFHLAHKANDLVESLSGGMRRRLQVARALINKPKLLILDEPTTGLDPEARRTLWDVIESERQNGTAILLSTHYMDEAERLCDRVAIISDGRILDEAPPRDLIHKICGTLQISEEIRPGLVVQRSPNLEDVYLRLTGARLGSLATPAGRHEPGQEPGY